MKAPDLFEVDVDLENAITDFRQAHTRLKGQKHTGRLSLTTELLDGVTIGKSLALDSMTEADIDRLMREKPGWDK